MNAVALKEKGVVIFKKLLALMENKRKNQYQCSGAKEDEVDAFGSETR